MTAMPKHSIATGVAILFHVCGLAGILFSPWRDWFIQNTPLNLALMAVLLIWVQTDKKIGFFLFAFCCFLVGMGAEMIGVHTGRLFGEYQYGTILGYQWNKVPLLIGVNWFVVVYAGAAIIHSLHQWTEEKIAASDIAISPLLISLSWIFDGALLATFFDWIMEPVAVKLGFWQWKNGSIPFFNYLCWFGISALLLWLLRSLRFEKANHFAVHLFIIQVLFFLTLRIYL